MEEIYDPLNDRDKYWYKDAFRPDYRSAYKNHGWIYALAFLLITIIVYTTCDFLLYYFFAFLFVLVVSIFAACFWIIMSVGLEETETGEKIREIIFFLLLGWLPLLLETSFFLMVFLPRFLKNLIKKC